MTYTLDTELPRTATPSDYSRIHFDPSELPAKRIVGLLACQRDPLLRTLETRVHSVQRAAAPPVAQKGRQKKSKKGGVDSESASASASGTVTPAEPAGVLWDVELEDTVVFPEGGGQPWDTGVLTLGELELPVEGCVRRGLAAVHHVRVPADVDLSSLPSAAPGSPATVGIHWHRRADHMVTHTAQHLLSAVLDTRGLPTLSWAMDANPGTDAYVELPRGITWAEAQSVEDECNVHIAKNLRVWIDVNVQREGEGPDTAGEGQESDVDRENRVIPKDYTGGVIRHCNIDGVDRNACCGTQCPSLSHVGFIHVLPPSTPWSATEPSSRTPTRLYFVAGPRAAAHLSAASRTLSRTAQGLGVPRDGVPERMARIDALRADAVDKEKALRLEVAGTLAEALASTLPNAPGSVANLTRTSAATHDFEFVNAVAGAFFARLADDAAGAGTEVDARAALVLVSAAESPALLLVHARDAERGKKLYEAVRAKLADLPPAPSAAPGPRVKGGGARGRFMAKVEGWNGRDAAAVRTAIEELDA